MKLRLSKPSGAKKNKKTQRSQKFKKLLSAKPLLIIAFVLMFGGFGVYKLLQSHAATGSWCNNTWVDIPGGGLAYGQPTVDQSRYGSWQMIVAVRGLDNAIWYTTMDSVSLLWKGNWTSIGGQTYASPKVLGQYIEALGTDNNTYLAYAKNNNDPNFSYSSWWLSGYGPNQYNSSRPVTEETPSNYHYFVRTASNNHIQYSCYKI